MKKATYLIPTTWFTSAPGAYRYDKRKKDMRTSFCKRYKEYESTDSILVSILKKYIDKGDAVVQGNRLYFCSGIKASLFYKEMIEGGWYNAN